MLRCRRDQCVLSSLLEANKTIPPLCEVGTFCPDDASTCLPLVPVGGHCQLNRDGMYISVPSYPRRYTVLNVEMNVPRLKIM